MAAGEQIERVQALAFAMVALLVEALLEIIGRFMNRRQGLVHGCSLGMLSESLLHAQDTSELLELQR